MTRQDQVAGDTHVVSGQPLASGAKRSNLGRDLGPWSTRISSKGALLQESVQCLWFLSECPNLLDLRRAVLEKDLLDKRTGESRLRCWHSLTWRYFWPPGNPVAIALAAIVSKPSLATLLRGAIYYHHCVSDRVTYDVSTGLIWQLETSGRREVSVADIERFLTASAREHREVLGWSPATRRKVAHSISAALRDFGRLEGKVKKRLARPPMPRELLLYVTRFLREEGRSARDILFSPDFRLWGRRPEDVAQGLRQEAARGEIRFEWTGTTVFLDLGDESFGAYAEHLGSEVR